MSHKGVVLALLAGTMAALASVSAKLATSYDEAFKICSSLWRLSVFKDLSEIVFYSSDVEGLIEKTVLMMRLLGVAGILLFNGLMWTLFTKSLQLCSSSVEATVTNTAANFLVTAVVSNLMFQERLPLMWWMGSCFILFGLLFIHKGGQRSQSEHKKKS